jgi:hypothetical protein
VKVVDGKHIENDDDLDPIRHTDEFKSLMEQYFN